MAGVVNICIRQCDLPQKVSIETSAWAEVSPD